MFRPCVIKILVLLPSAISVKAVEIVSSSLHERSLSTGFLFGEPFVVKVIIHVDSFGDFHCVQEAIPRASFL